MHPVDPDRAAMRQRLLAAREALTPDRQAVLGAQLGSHLAAWLATQQVTTLAFCWPWRNEPDMRGVVADWLGAAASRRACLPVVVERDAPLRFRAWLPGATLAPDACGIPAPAHGAWLQPDLMLVPVNGFDSRGFRLGYGGGYFDRTLATLTPAPVTVGLGYELSRCVRINEAAHDRPLDWLVTEAGVFRAER